MDLQSANETARIAAQAAVDALGSEYSDLVLKIAQTAANARMRELDSPLRPTVFVDAGQVHIDTRRMTFVLKK